MPTLRTMVGAMGQAAVDPCGLPGQSPPAIDVKRDAVDSGRGRAFSDNCRQRAYAVSYKLATACGCFSE
jgi:hypothetical protein